MPRNKSVGLDVNHIFTFEVRSSVVSPFLNIIIIIIKITSIYGAIHQIDTMALTRPKTLNTFIVNNNKRNSSWK